MLGLRGHGDGATVRMVWVLRELAELTRDLVGRRRGRVLGFLAGAVAVVVFSTAGWLWFEAPFRPAAATSLAGAGPITVCGPVAFAPPWSVTQNDVGSAAFRLDDVTVTPLARYAITGRVLSRQRYRLDELAAVSPLDLAVGWGPMAAPTLSGIRFRQSGRFGAYEWGPAAPSVPVSQIDRNFANIHLVPADATVARTLESISAGDTVQLSGHLVNLTKGDRTWITSRVRDDIGPGACEIVYVCGAQVIAA